MKISATMAYDVSMSKNILTKQDKKKYKHAVVIPSSQKKIRKKDLLTRIILLEEKLTSLQRIASVASDDLLGHSSADIKA